ncbi:hypothetical protein KS4_19910 [Poriferisphaera corsica]|uniref:Prepilin-type N-terminal cleavage/methylation domain-containing protein n=1 Tax=Poriferisphaera corsica TaxID=2528020 RepID=A0A517YUM6_9BACT|nr:prepilin-type N-terminal cleavage/methylation domain-containing protein [Poriferisphaera corsica]QDU33931.1 hypothetical protein KS4_19910 [Poriferisphaera corsica]
MKNDQSKIWRRLMHDNRGFTLMEVLIALGIFSMGMMAVAMIFPAAISIQRDTVETTDGRRIAQSAQVIMQSYARSAGLPTTPPSEIKGFFTFNYDTKALTDPAKTENDPYQGTLGKWLITNDEGDAAEKASAKRNEDFNTNYIGSSVRPMTGVLQTASVMSHEDVEDQPFAPLQHPLGERMGVVEMTRDQWFSFSPTTPTDQVLFTPETMTYPSSTAEPWARDYIWYPFLSHVGENGWRVFIIVAKNTYSPDEEYFPVPLKLDVIIDQPNDDFYTVMNTGDNQLLDSSPISGNGTTANDNDGDGASDLIHIGDQILDSLGNTHTVIDVQGDRIYTDYMVTIKQQMLCFYFIARLDNTSGSKSAGERLIREVRSPLVGIYTYPLFPAKPIN